MPHSYAVRITAPYADVVRLVASWALKADTILCYEHVGEKTKKPHVHLLIENTITADGLRKDAKSLGYQFKGNRCWSFKTADETLEHYMTYMSKGRFEPKYNKGYDTELIAKCKAAWVEPSKQTKKSSWELAVEDFEDYMDTCYSEKEQREEYATIEAVKRVLWQYVMAQNGAWSPRSAQLYKTITLTYCWKRGIAFDEKLLWK